MIWLADLATRSSHAAGRRPLVRRFSFNPMNPWRFPSCITASSLESVRLLPSIAAHWAGKNLRVVFLTSQLSACLSRVSRLAAASILPLRIFSHQRSCIKDSKSLEAYVSFNTKETECMRGEEPWRGAASQHLVKPSSFIFLSFLFFFLLGRLT